MSDQKSRQIFADLFLREVGQTNILLHSLVVENITKAAQSSEANFMKCCAHKCSQVLSLEVRNFVSDVLRCFSK